MCVTCYQHDPREVRWIGWLEKRQSCWVAPLLALLCEASEESKASFFAALGRVFP